MGRTHRFAWLAVVATLLTTAALTTPSIASTGGGEGVPALNHVFVIIGENTDYGLLNEKRTPYLLGTLKPAAAWFTDYRAVAHNSLADYVGLTSGQFTRCEQNDGLPGDCHQNVNNIFLQLDQAGVSWQAWMESMAEPCSLIPNGSLDGFNFYHPVHNPALYYDSIEGAGGVWSESNKSAECLANDIPMGSTLANDTSTFDTALAKGTVAKVNFIVPNLCEDGHNRCSDPKSSRFRQFDNFLRREVPRIEASPAFGRNSAIVVLYDEGHGTRKDTDGGQVACAVLGPRVIPGEYAGSYSHYSVLRTLEDAYRLPAYLEGASTAAPMNAIWTDT
jgi:phosphatidylinositol-3-phosphatase